MRRPQDRKDVLLEVGLTLASELSLPMVLQRIVDLAAQVTDARYGALGVIGDGGELVEFITTGLSAKQRRAIGSLPRGRGILGLLIREPRSIRIEKIGDHPKSVGFPAHHPPMGSFLGAPVKAMGKVFGNIYLTEKRSAPEFSEQDEESLVVLATQAGVAIANATLYAQTHQRERWLDALRAITSDILAGSDADSLLAGIAEHARDLAGADSASILTTSSTPGQLVVAAAVGAHAGQVRGQMVPAAKSISGEVMESGRPLVTKAAAADGHAYQPIIRLGRVGPAIFVPLRVRGRATGTLMVANLVGGRHFNEETIRLVETFADQASVAIEYARAQTDLRRLELMEERERIAKELHDGIIQSLFAVGMNLQSTALMSGSAETSRRVDKAVDELDRVIRDLRNYIFGLRPGILADRQLNQALEAIGEEVGSTLQIPIAVEVDGAVSAALSSRSHEIVQLTREALSNVTRHAQAQRAAVRLTRQGANAVLTIEDEGVGFDPREASSGSGLRNMRERAAAIGATLHISSATGKGTKLRFTFPADALGSNGPDLVGPPTVGGPETP
ncbi:MAG TPA: GAF domain-containing sensor histidine kinase [Candidatus Dormibacteraeota bacterium]|nr:GAF domain-containing sensor histidine kinase [Candidatus Dormibacteraeota bacterium]